MITLGLVSLLGAIIGFGLWLAFAAFGWQSDASAFVAGLSGSTTGWLIVGLLDAKK